MAKANSKGIPERYKIVQSGSFPDIYDFTKHNVLEGTVSQIKTVTTRRGKKLDKSRIAYIANTDGEVFGVWESAALREFMGQIKKGDEVFIRFNGLKKIKGQKNPMKDFTTGIVEGK